MGQRKSMHKNRNRNYDKRYGEKIVTQYNNLSKKKSYNNLKKNRRT